MSRVAVIAVHGVADQQPGDSGRAITHLLANLDLHAGQPAYSAFAESRIQIPVRPLPVPDGSELSKTTFAKRAASLRRLQDDTPEMVDVNIEFMSTAISGYEPSGPEETYDTTQWSATRAPQPASGESPSQPPLVTDVFEFFWADQSRLSQKWLTLFTEFFQLLFHLGSLGVHVVTAARVVDGHLAPAHRWERWVNWQRRSADALAIGLVTGNLLIMGCVALLLLGEVPWPWSDRYSPPVGVAGLGLVGWTLSRLFRRYEAYRPGAWQAFVWMAVPVAAVFLTALLGLSFTIGTRLHNAALLAMEVAYLATAVAWLWLLVSVWAAYFAGRTVVPTTGPRADVMARVQWTARIAVGLQTAAFVIATIAAWLFILVAIGKLLPGLTARTYYPFFLEWVFRRGTATIGGLGEELVFGSAGAGFGLLLAMMMVAIVISLHGVVPAAWYETFPPAEGADGRRAGERLSRGFARMRFAGRLVVLGLMVAMPLTTLIALANLWGWPVPYALTWLTSQTKVVLTVAGGLLLGTVVSVTAFRGRLKNLALRMRGGLDVALDVDNYLREHPRGRTPRARIVARYASLLRHVTAHQYDRIVIIAHSQGSVITADLLRYLRWQDRKSGGSYLSSVGLERLRDCPVTLFTMGCPLRQLYSLRFPHLYEWARHTGTGRTGALTAEPIASGTAPNPAEIGVALWVNAYRTGDYVGRHIWRADDSEFLFASASATQGHPWTVGPASSLMSESFPPPVSQREFCIGKGAHTHYWDYSAPQIGLMLDSMIRG